MPPVVLCILDGWGLSKDKISNAPVLAKTPNFDYLWNSCPKTTLLTHGLDVGLPKGQMGNSEVGHMNIGAGRIISMDLGQIDLEIENENFFKNEVNCNLKGEYSSAFVNGIFSLKENQQHEIRTIINHLVENTKSYQLIKSVLGKLSKAAYQGKIFVNSKAQKTDGYQLSKAILLDETSEFNAKPELEIYADDVKCSHGSASGSLNENSIFYLMSRGLNYQQSKELLINGFLLDVVEKITDLEIKNLIKNIIGLNE